MDYECLLDEACNIGLVVKELSLVANKGRISGNRIAIKKDIPTLKEKSCILAEEIGHYHTTVGNITDQHEPNNRKQEQKARLWGYNKKIGLIGIINAYNNGCMDIYEASEFLDVTEDFLKEALECYRQKYGEYVTFDNYIIYFEPYLQVGKML